MNAIKELNMIFDSIHNKTSTSSMPPEFEFHNDIQSETWFDKYILRWV